ncbi:uncharacterized protein [Littorina saxatilis]|uniref:uncharacterized protein n=1 Tax=Littorina saxatilis TaxID=31220 RepID=UPI0038B49E1B
MTSCVNSYTAYENSGLSLECQWQPDKTHSWSLDRRLIATCGANNSSCTLRDTGVVSDSSLQVGSWNPGVSRSTMSVPTGQERALAGYVQCESDDEASGCDVRVVHITEATCSIYIQTGLWTVQIVCTVTKMYDSDRRYSCKLPARPGLTWQPSNSNAVGNLTLHSYMENNTEYQRGTCIFQYLRMPTSDGSFKGGVEFVPSPKGGFVKTPDLLIATPKEPPTFLNCLGFINEGDDMRCTCQPASSFPRAVTKWSRNTEGQAAHMLLVRNVSKADIGRGFECTQSWSQNVTFVKRKTYLPEVGGEQLY